MVQKNLELQTLFKDAKYYLNQMVNKARIVKRVHSKDSYGNIEGK